MARGFPITLLFLPLNRHQRHIIFLLPIFPGESGQLVEQELVQIMGIFMARSITLAGAENQTFPDPAHGLPPGHHCKARNNRPGASVVSFSS